MHKTLYSNLRNTKDHFLNLQLSTENEHNGKTNPRASILYEYQPDCHFFYKVIMPDMIAITFNCERQTEKNTDAVAQQVFYSPKNKARVEKANYKTTATECLARHILELLNPSDLQRPSFSLQHEG